MIRITGWMFATNKPQSATYEPVRSFNLQIALLSELGSHTHAGVHGWSFSTQFHGSILQSQNDPGNTHQTHISANTDDGKARGKAM